MDEERMDAAVAEVVVGLVRARRDLEPATFRDMVGAIMIKIDQGLELTIERAYRRRPAKQEGNVVLFPTAPSSEGSG